MLNKRSSNQSPAWKLGLVMPVILAFMLLFNVKTEAQVVEKEKTSTEEKSEAPLTEEIIIVEDEKEIKAPSKSKKEVVVIGNDAPQVEWKTKARTLHFKNDLSALGANPLYVINGKEYKASKLRNKYVSLRSALEVIKGEEAKERFGERANNGAIIIPDGRIIRNFDREIEEVEGRSYSGKYMLVGENGKPNFIQLESGDGLKAPRATYSTGIHAASPGSTRAKAFVIRNTDSSSNHRLIKINAKDANHISFAMPDNFSQHDDQKAKTVVGYSNQKPLFVIDDEIQPLTFLAESVDPEKIASMTVLKGGQATAEYGEKGENGVIIIEMKKDSSLETASIFKIENSFSDQVLAGLQRKIKEETGYELDLSNKERNAEGILTRLDVKFHKSNKMVQSSFMNTNGIPDIIVGVKENGGLIISSSE